VKTLGFFISRRANFNRARKWNKKANSLRSAGWGFYLQERFFSGRFMQ